jgi:bifunctional non-homologous end joining protein LigD
MFTTLVDEPFDDEDWVFEIKWDGYRALGSMVDGKVDLRSRNDISFADRYKPVINALAQLDIDTVIDGEIVSLNEEGLPNFQNLQAWQKFQQGRLVFYVFDLLWIEGYDITQLPLLERKKILLRILPADNDTIRYSDHVEKNGKHFFDIAKQQGLEGIIAKNKNSVYEIDSRSRNWLKIKTTGRQEAVIAGFTAPRSGRQYFGALILGVYQGGKLIYAGHTGSGFDQKTLKDIWKKLKPLVTDKCPFGAEPKTNMPSTWVKPKLVCEIKFQEWTQGNIMRQPIFMGLRTDKNPTEVKKEKEMETKKIKKTNNRKPAEVESLPRPRQTPTSKKKSSPLSKKNQQPSAEKKNKTGDWLPGNENDLQVKLNSQELKLSNLDKVYWKKEFYTKRDLLNYYHAIAPFMLPYMKDRPQSLNRHPNGIEGMSFFQKNVEGKVPGWIKTFPDYSESNKETIQYFVCTNEASLIYLANLGCIEMNPWHSTVIKPDNPDYCLIDLDPHEVNFEKVTETAQVVKKVLDELKIPAWCKTSGSSGMHICIPLGARYNYNQSKHLAELIANLVHHEVPAFTSVERSPSKRRRKVYLDFLQNAKSQTVACVYSVRPKPGATVSTPVYWEEVKKGLSPATFTIKNIFERLKTEGDIFKPVYEKGIDLKKTLMMIESVLQ